MHKYVKFVCADLLAIEHIFISVDDHKHGGGPLIVAVDHVIDKTRSPPAKHRRPTTAYVVVSGDTRESLSRLWDEELSSILTVESKPLLRHHVSDDVSAMIKAQVDAQLLKGQQLNRAKAKSSCGATWYAIDMADGKMASVSQKVSMDLEVAFSRPDDNCMVRTRVIDADNPIAKEAAKNGTVAFECVMAVDVADKQVIGVYNRTCRMYAQKDENEYEDYTYQMLSDSTMQLRIGNLDVIVDVLPISNPLAMVNDPYGTGQANCTLKQFVRVVMRHGKVRKFHVVVAAIAARRIRAGDTVTYDYGSRYWPNWSESQRVRNKVCRSICSKLSSIKSACDVPVCT